MELHVMSHSKQGSPMSLDEASKLQENYAKSRHARHLEIAVTNLIHDLIMIYASCSSTGSNWSEEERQLIKKIEIACDDTREQALRLEKLSRQLTSSYVTPSSLQRMQLQPSTVTGASGVSIDK